MNTNRGIILTTNMKKSLVLLLVICLLFLTLLNINTIYTRAAEEPIELKILSAWGIEYLYVQEFLVPYIEKLNTESGGRFHATWVGPEAVPTFEQLLPLSTGLFDILISHGAYHSGETVLGIGMDLVPGRPEAIRKAGFYEILNEAYQEENVKVIGLISGDFGYGIVLKKPVEKADFHGWKLRSSPSYDPLLKALGASTVHMPVGDIYSALEKGVVDGAAWPVLGVLEYKWYEVAKYLLRPQYGQVANILLMNLDTWNNLSPELQDLFMEITVAAEAESYDRLTKKAQEEEKILLELGMELVVLPEEEAKKFLQLYYDLSWEELVVRYSPDLGSKLREIAEQFY